MKTYALDFETTWSNELTVRTSGSWKYFDALSLDQIYLVSIVSEDRQSLVGAPKDVDWSFMEGSEIIVWNGNFEAQGLRRLRDLGLNIPAPGSYVLSDAADMARYVGLPAALANAVQASLGIKVDKSIRDVGMKGREWRDMDPEFRERVMEYALKDSEYTLQLWNKHKADWPEHERLLSRLTREWAMEGIGADTEAMSEAMGKLKLTIWEAGTKLPWFNPDDPKSVPLSHKQLAIKCREVGIPCPKSLAIDDEDCTAWMEQYGEQYPWVGAMREYRGANAQLKKYEAMRGRVVEGRLRYELKYFGAGMTGRWSGSSGWNAQNASGKVLFETNMRESLVAPEGKLFVVSDLAQIEPRVMLWVVGDTRQLGIIAGGVSPYIAHAIATMGVDPSDIPSKSEKIYRLAKFRVLGLGYGCGHLKFIDLATSMGMADMFDDPAPKEHREAYEAYITKLGIKEWINGYKEADDATKNRRVNSFVVVQDYRSKSPLIVGLWNKFKEALQTSAASGQDLTIELPSGRKITYRKCRFRRVKKDDKVSSEVVADINRGGREETTRLYGGLCAENLVQATARDVMGDCLIRLHEAGYKVALHVHDEAVVEVPEAEAEFHRNRIEQLMSVTPAWAPGLPVAAEATIAKKYSEAK
jgi:DNA polymerase I-like protein with 3'-5' exonuclease and polymerase domains